MNSAFYCAMLRKICSVSGGKRGQYVLTHGLSVLGEVRLSIKVRIVQFCHIATLNDNSAEGRSCNMLNEPAGPTDSC